MNLTSNDTFPIFLSHSNKTQSPSLLNFQEKLVSIKIFFMIAFC